MIDFRVYWALTASLLAILSITFIAPSIRLKKLKYSFILINFTLFVWNFGYFLLNLYKMNYLLRVIYIGDAFIGPAMILFTANYMRIDDNKWIKKYILTGFIISTILSILIYSEIGTYYVFKRIFIITIFSMMISAVLMILFWFGKEKNTDRKSNLTLLAIIYLVGILGGITDFLPHNFGIRLFSVGNITATIVILSFMIVISKETILPRKEYIANVITYILTFLLISTLYTIIVFSMKNKQDNFILLSIFLASFVAVIMIPVINRVETEIVDKYLIKERTQLQKFLKDIGNYLIAGIDETDIIGYSIFTLKDLFPDKEFYFLRFINDFGYIKIFSTASKETQDLYEILDIDALETTINRIKKKEVLYVDELINGELRNYLTGRNIKYVIPVKYSSLFIGLLGVGAKETFLLSSYNEELIKNVSKSMALSLSNAKIYQSQAENKKNSEIENIIHKIGEEYKPSLIKILNNMEYIGLKNYSKKETMDYLYEIKREVIHIYNFTIDMLKYAKSKKQKKRAVNINEVLEDALNIVYIPTGIKAEKNLGDLPKITVFQEDILRAFTNIISNSVEAIVDNGTIALTTKYDNINNRVIILVEDSGTGIDRKLMQSIFSPLFTTKSGNAGIGLAIAKKVIENHGGKIQIFSKEGDGTTIRIVLPVV